MLDDISHIRIEPVRAPHVDKAHIACKRRFHSAAERQIFIRGSVPVFP